MIRTLSGIWRRVYSINEMGKYRPDVIEACLAHKEPDAIRLVYNRAQYMEERRILMQEWADYLDDLKFGNATR